MNRRVVITGMGAVSPLGLDAATTWDMILQSRSAVGPITLFDASTYPCRIAAEVQNFSLDSFVLDDAWTHLMNRGTQFGVAAAQMAMDDANLQVTDRESHRAGVSLGSGSGRPDLSTLSAWCQSIARSGSAAFSLIDPLDIISTYSHAGSSLISILHNARGPNLSVSTACSSGANAIGIAFRAIQQGEIDLAIAGGHDSMIREIDVMAFALLRALSGRNEEPATACRPFDRTRDGAVLGEGAAVFVLEELSHATARGARILGEIAGYGASLDAYHIAATHPEGRGAALAMSAALQDAGMQPTDIDYVNAHGTSTVNNDRTETAAIKQVFGEYAYQVPISSTKSMFGHTLAAAGALELAVCVMAMNANVVPPTINYEYPDPHCDLDYVPNHPREAQLNTVMSNSFAFGGANAVLIVKKLKQ